MFYSRCIFKMNGLILFSIFSHFKVSPWSMFLLWTEEVNKHASPLLKIRMGSCLLYIHIYSIYIGILPI